MELTSIVALFVTAGRMTTAVILIVAAVSKLSAGPDRFSKAILGYDLLSQRMALLLAFWLPWAELVSGVLLAIGLFSRVAALMGSGLFLIFCVAIEISLLRGRQHGCGCFGNGSTIRWQLVYRDLALFGILLTVYAFEGGALALDGWARLESSWFPDPWPMFWGLTVTWLMATGATATFHFATHFKLLRPIGKGELT